MMRWIAVVIAVTGVGMQDAGSKRDEMRNSVASALEKTTSKGGLVLTGKVQVGEPKGEGMTFDIADPSAGPQVEGDFAARVAADGTAGVVIEKKGYTFELFARGDRRAHRLSWAGGGTPIVGDVANDLHRLLQWGPILKEAAKAKEVDARPDAAVDGAPCRVVMCALPADLLDPPPAKKPEHPPHLEVSEIEATFSIDKSDGLVRQIDVQVTRKMNLAFGGGGEDILVVSVYRLTVGSIRADLKVEVPADLEKQLR